MPDNSGYTMYNSDPINAGFDSGLTGGDPIGLGLTQGMPDATAPIGGGGVTPPPTPQTTAQNMGVDASAATPNNFAKIDCYRSGHDCW